MKTNPPTKTERFVSFFYDEVPPECITRKWHALAYHDYMRRRSVMVIWPFHYVLMFAFWISCAWDEYRHRPSWIDRRIREAIEKHNQ